MKITFTVLILMTTAICYTQDIKRINKNGMSVQWEFKNNRIHFSLEAPTKGWLAIGFNKTRDLKGTYLIMGAVKSRQAIVVEHYVLQPGKYKSFSKLDQDIFVRDVRGDEDKIRTQISFSLPIEAHCSLAHNLAPGTRFDLLIAYSQDDDFQHHSIMRTNVNIIL